MAEKLLTIDEAAAHLTVKAASLRWMRRCKKGPPFCKIGGAVRYRAIDLDAWVASTVKQPGGAV